MGTKLYAPPELHGLDALQVWKAKAMLSESSTGKLMSVAWLLAQVLMIHETIILFIQSIA